MTEKICEDRFSCKSEHTFYVIRNVTNLFDMFLISYECAQTCSCTLLAWSQTQELAADVVADCSAELLLAIGARTCQHLSVRLLCMPVSARERAGLRRCWL